MKTLKRGYNSTIVSMTDKYGKTGNVDFRDCHMPDDDELAVAAMRYNLTEEVKFTITSVVGVKTKFVADIVRGRLERRTEATSDMDVLKKASISLYLEERSKLEVFLDVDFSTPECLAMYSIDKKMVEDMVSERRKGIWAMFPDSYSLAMFNCIFTELVACRGGV